MLSKLERSEFAYLLLSCLITLFLVGLVYGLDFQWIDAPVTYKKDSLLVLGFIKNGLENPWYHFGYRLGVPEGLSLADYPFVATIHFFFLKFFYSIGLDVFQATNSYYLLTFIFCTAAMYLLLRRLKVTHTLAVAGGVLYSLLDYHFFCNIEALWLSGYYCVPFVVLALLLLMSESEPSPGILVWSGFLVGLGDIYYSYYAVLLLLVPLAIRLSQQRFLEAVKPILLFLLPLLVTLCLSLSPFLFSLYSSKGSIWPETLDRRHPSQTEALALKMTPLLLPRYGHPIEKLNEAEKVYGNDGRKGAVSLGLFGTIGFIILIVSLFLDWKDRRDKTLSHLAKLNVWAILCTTVGGFSTLISYYFFSAFRANHRIIVYIGCLCTAALFIRLQFLLEDRRRLAGIAALLIISIAWYDQAYNRVRQPILSINRKVFTADKQFFNGLERQFPTGTAFAQWPHLDFPEGNHYGASDDSYTQLIPFLNTESAKWSFGTSRNSKYNIYYKGWNKLIETWQKDGNPYTIREAINSVVGLGFQALLIASDYFPDRGQALDECLKKLLKNPPYYSNDRFRVYDLRNLPWPKPSDSGT